MKKLLALVLCAVMVLAMIPAVTLTASAAGEGDWTTRRSPKDYDDPDDYASDYAEEFAYDEFGDDESEEAYDYGYEEAYDYWMDERGDDESD